MYGPKKWKLHQRYSSLLLFHKKIAQTATSQLPPFPPKKWGKGRFQEKFVERRRRDLERYFVALLELTEVCTSTAWLSLLNEAYEKEDNRVHSVRGESSSSVAEPSSSSNASPVAVADPLSASPTATTSDTASDSDTPSAGPASPSQGRDRDRREREALLRSRCSELENARDELAELQQIQKRRMSVGVERIAVLQQRVRTLEVEIAGLEAQLARS
eukprot:CAMPEP_0177629854 /NCGR_PEP_ID=MMETSP0447-20121125/889_1 /TAXON_ID=0 /ORGANISM="Stygamoeba regulata, Strain BSH-02190019" /LENGTH=215 /DNA_ID=CAMNT_0019131201 /DNA_START=150 /DNA_END=794 /DNA_ORIENTATION=-